MSDILRKYSEFVILFSQNSDINLKILRLFLDMTKILICTCVRLCVYPALEAVAVEPQLIPLFLHLLQLLLQLLDLFLRGKRQKMLMTDIHICEDTAELISI